MPPGAHSVLLCCQCLPQSGFFFVKSAKNMLRRAVSQLACPADGNIGLT